MEATRSEGAYDRVFYSGMAVAMLFTVLSGFAATYYLKLFGDAALTTISGKPFTPLVHLHGVLFTCWTLFFIGQTSLVASGRVAVHRRTGIAGVALAAAMIVAGVSLAIMSAARGTAPPGIDPLSFLPFRCSTWSCSRRSSRSRSRSGETGRPTSGSC